MSRDWIDYMRRRQVEIERILRQKMPRAERQAWLSLRRGYRARWRHHSVCAVWAGVFGGLRIDIDSALNLEELY